MKTIEIKVEEVGRLIETKKPAQEYDALRQFFLNKLDIDIEKSATEDLSVSEEESSSSSKSEELNSSSELDTLSTSSEHQRMSSSDESLTYSSDELGAPSPDDSKNEFDLNRTVFTSSKINEKEEFLVGDYSISFIGGSLYEIAIGFINYVLKSGEDKLEHMVSNLFHEQNNIFTIKDYFSRVDENFLKVRSLSLDVTEYINAAEEDLNSVDKCLNSIKQIFKEIQHFLFSGESHLEVGGRELLWLKNNFTKPNEFLNSVDLAFLDADRMLEEAEEFLYSIIEFFDIINNDINLAEEIINPSRATTDIAIAKKVLSSINKSIGSGNEMPENKKKELGSIEYSLLKMELELLARHDTFKSLKSSIPKYQEEVKILEGEIKSGRSEALGLKGESIWLKSTMSGLESQAGDLISRIMELKNQDSESENQDSELETQASDLESEQSALEGEESDLESQPSEQDVQSEDEGEKKRKRTGGSSCFWREPYSSDSETYSPPSKKARR